MSVSVFFVDAFLNLRQRIRQGWFDEHGQSLTDVQALKDHEIANVHDELDEDQMEQAVYCFEHVNFSPAGRRGVAGLNLPSLIFLCQLYTPNFPETSEIGRAHV